MGWQTWIRTNYALDYVKIPVEEIEDREASFKKRTYREYDEKAGELISYNNNYAHQPENTRIS
jgi:hypothetical protein